MRPHGNFDFNTLGGSVENRNQPEKTDRKILSGESISMFVTGKNTTGDLKRTPGCLKKLERMNRALRHEEPDQIPVGDFFWGQFIHRWKKDLKLPEETDIYTYYDLDWIATVPNMDPHIKNFEFIKNTPEEVIVRTGFEAEILKNMSITMPAFRKFHTDTIDKMEAFESDDPWDDRRYFGAGDNQIAGVGDGFALNSPPWVDTVKSLYNEFPVFGSICEAHEEGWRIIGSENMMLWMGLYPDKLGKFIKRVGEFVIEMTKAQIKAAGGLLSGMVVWGDVAYVNGMLFSPDYWRKYFKPVVAEIINICHRNDLPVIYHGCGDARVLYKDFIEMGLDSYNPLEAKAGLDVVDIRREHGHKMGFCGNMDVMKWADLPMEELKSYVLRKLNAAKGADISFNRITPYPIRFRVKGMIMW